MMALQININTMIKRESENSVRLCCGKKGCPVVTDLGDGWIQITDDDGNVVKMKKQEAEMISDGVKILDNKEERLILG
jgi:hypothetical protein